MASQRAQLTPFTLADALESIVSAASDDQCAASLASAAALLQDAVLSGQAPHSVFEAIESCPPHLAPVLTPMVDRAVSFAPLQDGSMLALWLQPVALSSPWHLPAHITLETASLNGIKMTAYLQEQLAVNKLGGWTYVLPTLLSAEQIRQADIGELIRLPHQARAVIRGEHKAVEFHSAAIFEYNEPGVSLYFLPVVACHPAGAEIGLPAPSERTMHRLSKWVADSFDQQDGDAERLVVHVAPQPQPFSEALGVGERLVLDVSLREQVMMACARADVQPNALAALVAPYVAHEMEDEFVLGVSLVSRLTGAFVETLSLPVGASQDTPSEIVSMVHCILQEMGMQMVQLRHDPIDTIACQHCGNLQYALPGLAHEGHPSTVAHAQ